MVAKIVAANQFISGKSRKKVVENNSWFTVHIFLLYFIFSTYVFFDFFFYSSPKGLVFKVLVYMLLNKLHICMRYIWILYLYLFSGNNIRTIFHLVIVHVHITAYTCLIFKLHVPFATITNPFMCIMC